jgi:hypothetical protein
MGVTVLWDNEEQTTLRVDLGGSWGWDEYDGAMTEASAVIKSVGQCADVIHNLLRNKNQITWAFGTAR